jgi:CRP/FNR family transcriptional regulator, cyclic AMP receptor protein
VTDVCDLERTFARTALLAGLSAPERRRLAARATTRSYPAGTTILRQGDTSMAVYVILSGRVAVHVGAQVVREIGADGFFGELGVLDDAPRSATIVALEPTECGLLGAWDVRRNLRIALGLLPILAQRLREAHAREPRSEAEWLAALTDDRF